MISSLDTYDRDVSTFYTVKQTACKTLTPDNLKKYDVRATLHQRVLHI